MHGTGIVDDLGTILPLLLGRELVSHRIEPGILILEIRASEQGDIHTLLDKPALNTEYVAAHVGERNVLLTFRP